MADAEVTGARGAEEVPEEEAAAANTSFINKKGKNMYIHDCKSHIKYAYLKLSIIVKKTT